MGFSRLIRKEVLPAMTQLSSTTRPTMWVAIDIAKVHNQVLVEFPGGRRRHFRMANTLAEFSRLGAFLASSGCVCRIAFEATGDYHRPLTYFLQSHGFSLSLVSSIAVARTRDALYNSWDKNDPKDAQVILHLLKSGTTQVYYDPLQNHYNDLQEMANTFQQISFWKVRVYHSIVTHFLLLYFPEAEGYLHSSRAEWGTQLLLLVPCPAVVSKHSLENFLQAAHRLPGQKNDKTRWLTDLYHAAENSIGCLWRKTRSRSACSGLFSTNTCICARCGGSSKNRLWRACPIMPISGGCRRFPASAPSSP